MSRKVPSRMTPRELRAERDRLAHVIRRGAGNPEAYDRTVRRYERVVAALRPFRATPVPLAYVYEEPKP